MSERLSQLLSQFTPSGKLDRDALIFQAGRASARPNRMWQGMVAALVLSQIITLTYLWQGNGSSSPPTRAENKQLTPNDRVNESVEPKSSPDSTEPQWLTHQPLVDRAYLTQLLPSSEMVPQEPPLRAYSVPKDLEQF